MNIKKIRPDPSQFRTLILTAIADNFVYENNVKTDRVDGFSLSVVVPDCDYETARLKVKTLPENLSREILATAGVLTITPVNFIGKFYDRKDRNDPSKKTTDISLRADSVEVVNK